METATAAVTENIGGVTLEIVISLESPRGHYTADACILWCFDDRFWRLKKKFLEWLGVKHVDVVSWAGASKDLVSPDEYPERPRDVYGKMKRGLKRLWRKFLSWLGVKYVDVMGQVEKSVKLHHAKIIILVQHVDCGAYGGSKALGSREEQYAYQAAELAASEALLRRKFPEVRVEKYIADFDGLRRITRIA